MRKIKDYDEYVSLLEAEAAEVDRKMMTYPCVAVDAKTCQIITPNKVVPIGKVDKEMGCSMYMRKCMSQYIPMLKPSDAWTFLMKNKTLPVKYNIFTSIPAKKYAGVPITEEMMKFYNTPNPDGEPLEDRPEDAGVKSKIKSLYPAKSGADLSKLELGDIVGMYYPASKHIVQAFAQSKKKYGNVPNFTFNTHVGFVGAIKDGEPIIFHNVTGTLLATPAKNLITVNPQGMIAWVIGDPEVGKKFTPLPAKDMTPEWWKEFEDIKGKGLEPYDFKTGFSPTNFPKIGL